jgi:hypothetical protein
MDASKTTRKQDRVDPAVIDCDENGIPRFWPDGTPYKLRRLRKADRVFKTGKQTEWWSS